MAEQIPDVVLTDHKMEEDTMEEEGLKAFVAAFKQKVEAEDKTTEEVAVEEMQACISELKRKKEADKRL